MLFFPVYEAKAVFCASRALGSSYTEMVAVQNPTLGPSKDLLTRTFFVGRLFSTQLSCFNPLSHRMRARQPTWHWSITQLGFKRYTSYFFVNLGLTKLRAALNQLKMIWFLCRAWELKDLCYAPTIPATEMYMIDQVRPTLTAMSARTHWFYLLTKFCFQILENLFPCAVITPLDCFWEGSKLLGPDVYVPWVPIMSLPLIMWIGQNADAWISDVVCYTASVKKVKKSSRPPHSPNIWFFMNNCTPRTSFWMILPYCGWSLHHHPTPASVQRPNRDWAKKQINFWFHCGPRKAKRPPCATFTTYHK